ncbi:hypothetical protein PIB30_077742 [Stylosanthes scabra]|uniref:Putative plant transposon protein domain-containing protein n=1 Tax=Stylosanthes scabra TaxID=79078 RepID=A0ABU6UPD5_9FABA|nr:hypothetical protein [Stylosanthes scabra]
MAPNTRKRKDTAPSSSHDGTRFKSLAYEKHYEAVVQHKSAIPEVAFSLSKEQYRHITTDITRRMWRLLYNPPQNKMEITLLREFYANAKMTKIEKQTDPHLTTFVRGKEVNFSPESIKVIFQLPGIADIPQSYEARKVGDDPRLNGVLRDIARGWFDFIRRSLIPSSNNNEVTVEMVVLIHSIMEGLDVKVEKLISDNILAAAENKDERSKLPFPSIIYCLLYANGIPQIPGDELVPVERPIIAESIERNRYIQTQQKIQQQAPPPPPQVQQEQVQQVQPLPQEFNWKELNQQFQGMRVDQS